VKIDFYKILISFDCARAQTKAIKRRDHELELTRV